MLFPHPVSECVGCGVGASDELHTCTHHCGYLASPMYPYPYPENTKTTWKIQAEPGNYIELIFHDLQVESQRPDCLQDYLLINNIDHSGDVKLIARLCNVKEPSGPLFSSWNKMQIELYSDRGYNGKGFFAEYKSKTFQISGELQAEIDSDGMYHHKLARRV